MERDFELVNKAMQGNFKKHVKSSFQTICLFENISAKDPNIKTPKIFPKILNFLGHLGKKEDNRTFVKTSKPDKIVYFKRPKLRLSWSKKQESPDNLKQKTENCLVNKNNNENYFKKVFPTRTTTNQKMQKF